MKLPGKTEGGVQKIGSVDPSVYRQAGRDIGAGFDAIAGVAAEAGNMHSDYKAREALINTSNSMSAWRTKWGNKRTFTTDELDELGVDVPTHLRTEVVNNDDGTEETIDRTEIPAYEVYPEALRKKWEGELRTQSKNVPGPIRRQKFMNAQQELINATYEREIARASTQSVARQRAKAELDIQEARIDGNWPLVRTLYKQDPNLTPEERKAEVQKSYQDEESYELFNLRMNDDASNAEIQAQIDRLENPIYGTDTVGHASDKNIFNSLTQAQREREISALNTTLRARKASMDKALEDSEGRAWQNFYATVADPSVSATDAVKALDAMQRAFELSRGDVSAALTYMDKYGKVDASRAKYAALFTMSKKQPDKFIAMNLTPTLAHLGTAGYERIKRRQEAMLDEPDHVRSVDTMVEQHLAMAGVPLEVEVGKTRNKREAKLIYQMETAVELELEAAREAVKGRPLTGTETRKAVNRAAGYVLISGDREDPLKADVVTGKGLFGSEKTLDAIPAGYIAEQRHEAERRGVPTPPDQVIYDQYLYDQAEGNIK